MAARSAGAAVAAGGPGRPQREPAPPLLAFDAAAVRRYGLVVAAVVREGRTPRSRFADLLTPRPRTPIASISTPATANTSPDSKDTSASSASDYGVTTTSTLDAPAAAMTVSTGAFGIETACPPVTLAWYPLGYSTGGTEISVCAPGEKAP